MRNVLQKSLMFLLISLLISCQSDLLNETKQNVNNNEVETFPIHVVYEGNDYFSQCSLLEDSLVIENDDLRTLIDEIFSKNDNVQTYVHGDIIEYFDNRELFEEKYKFMANSNISEGKGIVTRSGNDDYTNADGYAIVYEDDNYRGWSMTLYDDIDKESTMDHWDIDKPDNDKISSLKVHINILGAYTRLECFEDNNYRGASIVFNAFQMGFPYYVPNLKKIPRGRKNWGDAISSLRLSVIVNHI